DLATTAGACAGRGAASSVAVASATSAAIAAAVRASAAVVTTISAATAVTATLGRFTAGVHRGNGRRVVVAVLLVDFDFLAGEALDVAEVAAFRLVTEGDRDAIAACATG